MVGEVEVQIPAPPLGSSVTLDTFLGLLIVISSTLNSKNTHLKRFPRGLTWNQCDKLCKVSGK